MKEYLVIEFYEYAAFAAAVNIAMQDGWRPQGGVCVNRYDKGEDGWCWCYMQAMVR